MFLPPAVSDYSQRSGIVTAQVMTTACPTNHIYVRHISASIRHTPPSPPITAHHHFVRPIREQVNHTQPMICNKCVIYNSDKVISYI